MSEHPRCGKTTDCPCWTAGATAEAEARRLRPQTRQVVEYIRALSEGDPSLNEADIARRVADVFAATPSQPVPSGLDDSLMTELATVGDEHADLAGRAYLRIKALSIALAATTAPAAEEKG